MHTEHERRMIQENSALDRLPEGRYHDGTYEWVLERAVDGAAEWSPVRAPQGMPPRPRLDRLSRVVVRYEPLTDLELHGPTVTLDRDALHDAVEYAELLGGSMALPLTLADLHALGAEGFVGDGDLIARGMGAQRAGLAARRIHQGDYDLWTGAAA